MSTFTWYPAFGVSQSVQPRVRVAAFGDGYQQRVGDGINAAPRSWALVFTQETANVDAIEAFLVAAAGVTSFDWTPPSGAAGKWTCSAWSRTHIANGAQQISATFSEVFGE